MAVGERDEKIWRSIRVLGIDVFESREIAVIVVVVRDELYVS